MNTPPASAAGHSVVIGYGSSLRGDDSVGQRAALAVTEWALPTVRALARHQLTPELAEDIASARLVVFVDASADLQEQAVVVREVVPPDDGDVSAHSLGPEALLGLARALYGACPAALLVTIPVATFELGETLSNKAERGLAQALARIRELLAR